MLKRFRHYDAQGTDGSDPAQMLAVFDVLDGDGLTVQVSIPASAADGGTEENAALITALLEQPAAEPIGV